MTAVQCSVVAACGIVAFSHSAIGAQVYNETWDAGSTENWTGLIGTTLTAPVAGGNPAGFLNAASSLPSLIVRTTKPQFTGDYGAAAINAISVDIRSEDPEFPDLLSIEFRSTGPGSSILTALCVLVGFPDPPPTSWTTFPIPFDPTWTTTEAESNGWAVDDTSGSKTDLTFAALFADVQAVTFQGLRSDGGLGLDIGLDNMRLIPAPASALAFVALGFAPGRRRR